MPIADYVCAACETHIEHFFHHPLHQLPCEAEGCSGIMVRTFEPSITLKRRRTLAQAFSPVVIHRDVNGNIRFPGHPDAPIPDGFQKVELRTVREVRALEREMNVRERARFEEAQYREEQAFSAEQRERRAELRQMMRHMTPAGRALAEEAMRQNDERPRKSYDPNFHVEAFSQDSSNREAYRDERTGWRGRKQ